MAIAVSHPVLFDNERRPKHESIKKVFRRGVNTVIRLIGDSASKTYQLSSGRFDKTGRSASLIVNDEEPLAFHDVCGDNVSLQPGGVRAVRVESFCKGILFSNRPVAYNEVVVLQVAQVSNRWSGMLRLGFTSHDPAYLSGHLPKYACPDLTSKSGFWAKALSDQYSSNCNLNSLIHFYISPNGDVHFGIDGQKRGIFFSGVSTKGGKQPLWAMIDLYGNCTALDLVDGRAIVEQMNSVNMKFNSSHNVNSRYRKDRRKVNSIISGDGNVGSSGIGNSNQSQTTRLLLEAVRHHQQATNPADFNIPIHRSLNDDIQLRANDTIPSSYVPVRRLPTTEDLLLNEQLAHLRIRDSSSHNNLHAPNHCYIDQLNTSGVPPLHPSSIDLLEPNSLSVEHRPVESSSSQPTSTSFHFHPHVGRNVILDLPSTPTPANAIDMSGVSTIARRRTDEFSCGYVFLNQPLVFSSPIIHPTCVYQLVYRVLDVEPSYIGSMAFGLTTVDPSTLNSRALHDDSSQIASSLAALHGSWWNVAKDLTWPGQPEIPPQITDELHFNVTYNGVDLHLVSADQSRVHKQTILSWNGDDFNSQDGVAFWPFVDIYGHTSCVELVRVTRMSSDRFSHFSSSQNTEEMASNGDLGNVGDMGDCTVCFENAIDCALYTCGHMCMCHGCALIQWKDGGSGVCPLCREPIRDVIKTFKA